MCCKNVDDINSQCGFGVGRMEYIERESKIYITGCLIIVLDWLRVNLIIIGVALFLILFL